ncbi:hypothetical protein [Nocardia sp. NPDC047038]|uniref:hypothetical protein n=1 Tax=Nocardia sp. NPDC047038 TaxID=3154338 RepID=UPI0033CFBD1D
MGKPTALVFINRAESSDPALDLRHALAVADELRLHVLRCYVTGPMRPSAFRDLMEDARAQHVAMVLIPRVEPESPERLDAIRRVCTVLAVDTGYAYPQYGLALASAVSARRA